MSETVMLWLFGCSFGFTAAVGGAFFMHVVNDRKRDSMLSKIMTEVSDIKTEIGTHDAGMAGQLHRYSKIITRLCERAGIEQ